MKLTNVTHIIKKIRNIDLFNLNRLSFCQIISIFPQLTTYVFNKNIIKTVNYGQYSFKKKNIKTNKKNLFD